MLAAIGDFDACVPTYGDRPEPLLGCYSKSMIAICDDLANSGIRRVSAALANARTLKIPLEDLYSRLGDPGAYLVNANDPETFSRITTW
jgi:molybdopterin-guanine dinucleotide biosynthesis protein A